MKKSMAFVMVTVMCVKGADVVVPIPEWDGSHQEIQQVEEIVPPEEGLPMLKFAMKSYALVRHPRGHENEWLRMYAKTNGIPDSVLYGLAKEFVAEAEAVLKTKDPDRGYMHTQAARMLYLMEESNDPTLLPYLEGKTGSDIDTVRERSAVAYVTIAGVDSTALMRKLFPDNRENNGWWRHVVVKAFLQQLESAKSKAPKEKMDAAYAVLIEQAQNAPAESESDVLDRFLCKEIPEYVSSLQREHAVSRFLHSSNELVRVDFERKNAEVQKVPSGKRPDLRQRFKQLSEPKEEKPK
jgi:hypothetical protein